jgi:poly-gamma-glutamate synthesis protein (capsule biosynthesis protein)
MDRGPDNLYSAMNALDKAGIVYSGAGKDLDHARLPGYLELEKGLVALLATSTAEQGVTYYQQHTRATKPGNTYPGRPGLNGIRHDSYYTVDSETFEKIRELKSKFYESNKVSYSYFGRNERLELQRIPRPKEDRREEMLFLGNRFVLDKEIKMHFFMHPKDRYENIKIIKDVSKQADWTLATHHTHESKPYYDKETLPSDFIRKYAHDCIDAGADAYLGHGKHTGQGIEIYKNKPIIYSLANPIYGGFTRRRIPMECYEMFGLGLDSTPLEFMKKKGVPIEWLQSLLAVFTLEGEKGSRKLVDFKLYPIDGGADKPYSQFGVRPILVKNEKIAKKIINRYQKLSDPFGTKIEYKNGIGIVKI